MGWRIPFALIVLLFAPAMDALARGVAEGDKGYIQEISGTHLLPFTYLGAKHMVTGYDHLLSLAGAVFNWRDHPAGCGPARALPRARGDGARAPSRPRTHCASASALAGPAPSPPTLNGKRRRIL
jgi:hypothetical protein